MKAFIAGVIVALAWDSALASQATDTTTLLRAARRAESEYEAGIRRFAPRVFAEPRSRPCDEIVGRYCIYYEAGGDSLPPEPAEVGVAREKAIKALDRAHQAMPANRSIAFPLVRYLAQAGRTGEGVRAAARFAAASADYGAGRMLSGFALHMDRRTEAAEGEFAVWLGSLPRKTRDHIESVGWLLDARERKTYDALTEGERRRFETWLWRYADALYSTPGNEVRADHLSRAALSLMLAERRGIAGVDGWGNDTEELTIRFGPPVLTTRSWRTGGIGQPDGFSEHWDPALRTYVPRVPEEAMRLIARLDTIWPLDSLTARSGHAPPTIRIMKVLEHQAARFGDSLVVTGVAVIDSAAAAGTLEGTLFVLDSTLSVLSRVRARVVVHRDSASFTATASAPPGAHFYSAELYDPTSRLAARARFRLAAPERGDRLAISSLLLAAPFEPGSLPADRESGLLEPLTRPVLELGSAVGVYMEVRAEAEEPQVLRVQLENTRRDRQSGLGKIVGFFGRTLGLSNEKTPARLSWTIEAPPAQAHAIPVTLDLSGLEPGRYRMVLSVRDPATGASAMTQRDYIVVKRRSASRP